LPHSLLARLGEEPVDLALRLREHLLALLDDPARLLDLLRDGGAHLVEDVVDLLAVDADLVREGDGLRVVHEVVELVDQYEDVHSRESSFGGCPNGALRNRLTRPGSRASPGARQGRAP